MMSLIRIAHWLLAFIVLATKIKAKFEFTNLKCEDLDKVYLATDYCFLKSYNRTYKYASIKMLLKKPINSLTVNIALQKRLNGYKPFLYNITFDGCKVLSNPNGNPVAKYFYEFIKPFSNINHTCPYAHDLLIEKVPIDFVNNRLTHVLPVPEGDYLVETTLTIKGIRRFALKVYGSLS